MDLFPGFRRELVHTAVRPPAVVGPSGGPGIAPVMHPQTHA